MVRRVEKTQDVKTTAHTKKSAMGTKPVTHLEKAVQTNKGSAKAPKALLNTSDKAKHVVRNAFNYIKEQSSIKMPMPTAQIAVPSKAEMKKTKKAFKETESTLAKNSTKRRG